MGKDEIVTILRSLDREISEKYRARVKGMFGSVARGEDRPNSDVDILVEFLEGATLLDLGGLGCFLEERLGVPVDLVPIDTIRLEFKERILSEAIFI